MDWMIPYHTMNKLWHWAVNYHNYHIIWAVITRRGQLAHRQKWRHGFMRVRMIIQWSLKHLSLSNQVFVKQSLWWPSVSKDKLDSFWVSDHTILTTTVFHINSSWCRSICWLILTLSSVFWLNSTQFNTDMIWYENKRWPKFSHSMVTNKMFGFQKPISTVPSLLTFVNPVIMYGLNHTISHNERSVTLNCWSLWLSHILGKYPTDGNRNIVMWYFWQYFNDHWSIWDCQIQCGR